MRNLKADLRVCERATPEPWVEDGAGSVYSADDKDGGDICEMCPCRSLDVTNANAVFIAEAREGWPEAIRRAIKAEKTVQRFKCMHKSLVISVRLWLEKGDKIDIEEILKYHEQLAEKGEEWCIEPAALETAIRG